MAAPEWTPKDWIVVMLVATVGIPLIAGAILPAMFSSYTCISDDRAQLIAGIIGALIMIISQHIHKPD